MADGTRITGLLEAGLRAAGLRSKVIAHNIANLETPNFRRGEVRFEELLANALDAGKDLDLDGLKAQIVQPRTTPVNGAGNDVGLETEIGQMVENSAYYKTYVRTLNRIYKQMEMAMRDGL